MKKKYDVGNKYTLKTGLDIEILEREGEKIRIIFLNSRDTVYSTVASLSKGYIKHPKKEIKYDVGEVITFDNGESITILEVLKNCKRQVIFNDEFKAKKIISLGNLKAQKVGNPYRKTCFNVGYVGEGKYSPKINKEAYNRWHSIIRRCYSDYFLNIKESYKKVKVCEEWHNFQNFAEWYYNTFPHHIKSIRFDLDKDLKQNKIIEKIYSPSTCLWLPSKVNSFLCNSQKNNKSGYIGVNFDENFKKYRAQIKDFRLNKKIYLGRFEDIKDASNAYEKERKTQIVVVKNYIDSIGIYKYDDILLLDNFGGGLYKKQES